jgi:hypothetical protein
MESRALEKDRMLRTGMSVIQPFTEINAFKESAPRGW